MSIEKSQHEEFANNDNINDLDNIEMNIKSFHFVFDFQQKKVKPCKNMDKIFWHKEAHLQWMHLSIKLLYSSLYPVEIKKNFSVDKLYKDLCDYMHLLFEAMTSFARIYVFSLPYFAINININFVSALALSLFLGSWFGEQNFINF